ncbi:MAG TPA: PstS family phosphate ABC transporter substrate-binding protein [Solirubrobacterales bacterium]|nr:PstS family phosphate ABC transporter substrate-binding protein [Solirubrobacterales bacterium]
MSKSLTKLLAALFAAGILAFGLAACGGDDDGDNGATTAGATGESGSEGELTGTIRIDGSSTVAPLSEPAAELFMEENPDVTVTVGTSGTGGGFEKFCAGETDISDASRQIDEDEEGACAQNGIETEEVAVANDALTVVANPENPVTCLTVDQLAQVWGPGSQVNEWGQIQGLQDAPDAELALYGPGTDSGTFDYFTEAVIGEEGAQRTDYNNVGEDDNATVTGVSGTEGGMGYFGYSFFVENEGTLKALEIDNGQGCVAPSPEATQDGSYAPLGRQLFIYPSNEALQRPEVLAFIEFYIENATEIAEAAGFIGLTDKQKATAQRTVDGLAG